MPEYIEWIGFFATIIGLIISIGTLVTSLSVKRQVQQKFERGSFQNNKRNIIDKIDGFVGSINQDYIYKSDSDKTFQPALSQFLVALDTDFTFLSKRTKKVITSLHKKINNPNISQNDWRKIAEDLIALRNSLKKENL